MGSRQMGREEADRYGRIVWNFFDKMQKYKTVKEKFDAIKSDFESEMECLFHDRSSNSVVVTNHNLADGEDNMLKVTKVERTSIRWDIGKLRKRLPAGIFKKVIRKEYRVNDMPNLVRYLKSCGVNPEIFKQYISVEESVDQDAVDKMGELGYILPQQISGCYVVECAKPYFKVGLVKTRENG